MSQFGNGDIEREVTRLREALAHAATVPCDCDAPIIAAEALGSVPEPDR